MARHSLRPYVLCACLFALNTPSHAANFTDQFMATYNQGAARQVHEHWDPSPPIYWDKDDADNLIELVEGVPVATGSYAMTRLATRVLVEIPKMISLDEKTLIALIKKLSDLGAHADAVNMYQISIPLPDNEVLAQSGIEAMLLANKIDAACVDVQLLKDKFQSDFWQKLDALCHFAAGQTVAGQLKTESLKDKGLKDSTFFALAESLAEDTAPDLSVLDRNALSPLTLSMLIIHGKKIQKDIDLKYFSKINPSYFATLALAKNLPDLARQRFEKKTLALGLLSGHEINPTSVLLTKSKKANTDKEKTDFIQKGIEELGGPQNPQAYVFANIIAEINPEPSHISLALPAIIMLYGIGAHNQADKWLALMSELPGKEGEILDEPLWPVALLGDTSDHPRELQERMKDMMTTEKALADSTTRHIAAVLAGLGVSSDVSEKDKLFEVSSSHDKSLRDLKRAAKKHRRGESALMGLIAIGNQKPDKAEPGLVMQVLQQYRKAGLEQDARALGIEALVLAQTNQNKEKNYGSSRSSTH